MNKSIGQRFAESEAYTSMRATGRKQSDAFEVGSFHEDIEGKALSLQPAAGGVLVEPTRVPGILAPPDRRLFLRDLLPSQQSSGVIEYIVESGFTNAAAMVPEGGIKPPSDITFELKSVSAHVLAHVLTASRQILSDAQGLQTYVDTKMVYGLKFREEAQLLYGDGTGENLMGLLSHGDRQTYSQTDDGVTGDTKLHALRRAVTRVTLAEYAASGIVLNPVDKEEIDLLQGGDDHFLHLDVSSGNVPSYFRVPVVETAAIQQGQALVGALNLAARIHDVWNATVQLFEQHADYVTTNRVLVRAEERLALANERPEAIVDVEFAA